MRMRPDSGGTAWTTLLGGDGVDVWVNPFAPSMVFATLPGIIHRSVSPEPAQQTFRKITPLYPTGENPGFAMRLVPDPSNPAVYYTATNRLWKSADGGETWAPLPTTVTSSGGWPTPNIIEIAIAKNAPQTIMVTFTNASVIARTTNGGTSWTISQIATNGRAVTNLAIDPRDSNRVWATVAGMTGPSVYRTTNGGASWGASATGLPQFSAQVIRVDPTDSSALYAGTDVGVYRSTNSGDSWARFGIGLPAVAVDDIQILDDGSTLRAATHGRGMWELAITGVTNRQPVVTTVSPASPFRATRGVPVTFTGLVTDPDAGDTLTTSWTFPDDWTTSNTLTVAHTFNRGGRFPVTLRAIDRNGAIGAATVDLLVADAGDSCANPIEIPASGPFPYSMTFNTEGATSEASDPETISACLAANRQTTTWVSFTPATTGTYNFTFCGSRTTAALLGFTGSACGPYGFASVCLNNATPQQESASIDCANAAKTSATLTAGTTTRFMITNIAQGDFGPVTLTVSQSTLSAVVTSVSPASGSANGGTPIVLTGSGFTAGMGVQIGGAAATSVTVLTPNLATAVTPRGVVGAADVSASFTTSPSTVLAKAFRYIQAVAPTKGVPAKWKNGPH